MLSRLPASLRVDDQIGSEAGNGRHLGDDRLAEGPGPGEDGAGLVALELLAQGVEKLGEVVAEINDVRLLGDTPLQQGDATAKDVPSLVLASGGRD